jgi:beta-lactamase class A
MGTRWDFAPAPTRGKQCIAEASAHWPSTLAGLKAVRPAAAEDASGDVQTQLQWFRAFPGTTSWRIDVNDNIVASKSPGRQLFVASTIKTFIVCQYLRDVEAGRLSEDEQLSVDDSVRHSDSSVFLNLTGTTPARSILEAAITHSDNMATDIAVSAGAKIPH